MPLSHLLLSYIEYHHLKYVSEDASEPSKVPQVTQTTTHPLQTPITFAGLGTYFSAFFKSAFLLAPPPAGFFGGIVDGSSSGRTQSQAEAGPLLQVERQPHTTHHFCPCEINIQSKYDL